MGNNPLLVTKKRSPNLSGDFWTKMESGDYMKHIVTRPDCLQRRCQTVWFSKLQTDDNTSVDRLHLIHSLYSHTLLQVLVTFKSVVPECLPGTPGP